MQAKNPKIHVERSFYRSLLALTLPVALQNVISYSVNLMDTLMLGGLGEWRSLPPVWPTRCSLFIP